MDQKLQELTEKLYLEGVSKGNNEAEKIISEAKAEAEKIKKEAKAEADKIIDQANKKSVELEKNTKSEIQLAAGQMIEALKQEVIMLINGQINSVEIEKAIHDKDFIQQLILSAVTNWAPQQELSVAVSPNDKQDLENFITQKAQELLNKGLKIESANNIKAGFQIGPADGSFKVSFTENDFIEFFKAFLRPKVVELLFNKE